MTALPYVARFTHDNDEPPPDALVTSIGIDLGNKLTHWSSRLVETVTFELNDSGSARPFLITEKIPEHGRSGGGLFLANGDLVGVCVGHSELVKGRRMGVFAAGESIRRLLDDHQLTATILRSELRIARHEERAFASGPRLPTDTIGLGGHAHSVRKRPTTDIVHTLMTDSRRGRAGSRNAQQQQKKDDGEAPENGRVQRIAVQIKEQHQARTRRAAPSGIPAARGRRVLAGATNPAALGSASARFSVESEIARISSERFDRAVDFGADRTAGGSGGRLASPHVGHRCQPCQSRTPFRAPPGNVGTNKFR